MRYTATTHAVDGADLTGADLTDADMDGTREIRWVGSITTR